MNKILKVIILFGLTGKCIYSMHQQLKMLALQILQSKRAIFSYNYLFAWWGIVYCLLFVLGH